MNSYLYPTIPGWFEELLERWKSSGTRAISFPFLWFKPTTLPNDKNAAFWMYLYYTENQTKKIDLKRVVKFRVRVIEYSFSMIKGPDIYTIFDNEVDAKVWFRCDVVEEIRKNNSEFLHAANFEHSEGVLLPQFVRKSIAPIRRKSNCISVQKTSYLLND
ncbi:hypothetical protein [Methylobacillus flagellatus]|nr:hypothetical protein [Methylobacillus flagellatus]